MKRLGLLFLLILVTRAKAQSSFEIPTVGLDDAQVQMDAHEVFSQMNSWLAKQRALCPISSGLIE